MYPVHAPAEYGVGWIHVKRDFPQIRAPPAIGAAASALAVPALGAAVLAAEAVPAPAASPPPGAALAAAVPAGCSVGSGSGATGVPFGGAGAGGVASEQAPARNSAPVNAAAWAEMRGGRSKITRLPGLTVDPKALYSGRSLQTSPSNAPRAPRASLLLAGALFAVSAVIAASFGGCAQGKSLTTGSGGAGAGPGVGGGPTGGSDTWVGNPCETADACPEGAQCVQVGGQKICTQACPPECPDGSYCTLVEGDPFCVPDQDSQCGQCLGSAQCKGLTDECLKAPGGDKFCARDCTAMDDCPSGFICMVKTEYEALANPPQGGDGGAGGGGGGAGGLGLPDAGGKPPAGTPFKFCVPPDGLSCACNEKRDGVTKSCDIDNMFGHCPGTATCDGKGGAWVGCTAKTPAAETCNAADDDCNGQVDEADPNAMCGGAPPNAAWACNAGACEIGACDPGWTQYPVTAPADGCTCPVDASEPNDTCASPASAGSVTDAAGPVQLAGTLSGDGDVDVWTFDTVDTPEGTTNSYHVSIDVVEGEGSGDVLVDVIRGDACMDAPSGPAAGIVSYDWCVDGKSADGMAGEAPCAPDGVVHCNDNSAKYFVRVYRKPGAPGTCLSYKIQVSAKGGDPCDFTNQCL